MDGSRRVNGKFCAFNRSAVLRVYLTVAIQSTGRQYFAIRSYEVIVLRARRAHSLHAIRVRRDTGTIGTSDPRHQAPLQHLPVAEVVQEDVHALTFNTVIFHDDARAANDLAWVALTVDLAETSPSA